MSLSRILKDGQAFDAPITMYALENMINTDEEHDAHESAKQKAIEIVKYANMKREAIEMEAYKKGLEQGQIEGQKIAIKRLEPLFDTFKNAIEQLGYQRKMLTEQHIDQILKLVCLISEKIIHREIQASPDIVLDTVKSASTHLMETDEVRLRLHPSDYEYIREIEEILGKHVQTNDHIYIVEDNNIERGGVVIETSFGEIDATVRSQIEHIKEIIFEER
ncbi:MAG: hypothetical protein J7L53_06195 [Deltaproteobacteria bacterium]|nr:hypothetical protein [Deltaproteobacteria bacterium]